MSVIGSILTPVQSPPPPPPPQNPQPESVEETENQDSTQTVSETEESGDTQSGSDSTTTSSNSNNGASSSTAKSTNSPVSESVTQFSAASTSSAVQSTSASQIELSEEQLRESAANPTGALTSKLDITSLFEPAPALAEIVDQKQSTAAEETSENDFVKSYYDIANSQSEVQQLVDKSY